MKVVRHQYKCMQQIVILATVVKQNVQKQPSHALRLK